LSFFGDRLYIGLAGQSQRNSSLVSFYNGTLTPLNVGSAVSSFVRSFYFDGISFFVTGKN